MTSKEILETFASTFVSKDYQSRFVHDALKKPVKLMNKICHDISYVFPEKFLNCNIDFDKQEKCLFYIISGHMTETTWGDAMNQIKKYGSGGYLVIDANGGKFYAEPEGEPPFATYAGTTNKTQEPIKNPQADS